MENSKESLVGQNESLVHSEVKSSDFQGQPGSKIESSVQQMDYSIKESGLLREKDHVSEADEAQIRESVASSMGTSKLADRDRQQSPTESQNIRLSEQPAQGLEVVTDQAEEEVRKEEKAGNDESSEKQANAEVRNEESSDKIFRQTNNDADADPLNKKYAALFKESDLEGGLQRSIFDEMIQRKRYPEKKQEAVSRSQKIKQAKLSIYEVEPFKPVKNRILPPIKPMGKKNRSVSSSEKKRKKKNQGKSENQENFASLQINREPNDISSEARKTYGGSTGAAVKQPKLGADKLPKEMSQEERSAQEKSKEDKPFLQEFSTQEKGTTQTRDLPKAFQIKKRLTVRKTTKENRWKLTAQEQNLFGNRFPSDYTKLELLGKGGFSLVWKGEHNETKQQYAIKQILKRHPSKSHMKEIFFGNHFFSEGVVKKRYAKHGGVKSLTRMMSYIDEEFSDDVWVIYELVEGIQLSKSLYEIIEITTGNEKTYAVDYKGLYCSFIREPSQIYKLVYEVAQAISAMSDNHIMHCDLKPDNLIVQIQMGNEPGTETISAVKIIDYGSCHIYEELKNIRSATPEYMPPEVLYLILKNYNQDVQDIQKFFSKALEEYPPWAVDIWSLGCILLEILTGIPLWMTRECEFHIDDETYKVAGLFGEKGRPFKTIIKKQIFVLDHLDDFLDKYGNKVQPDDDMVQLIKRMMDIYPKKRISPRELLSYPLFKKY